MRIAIIGAGAIGATYGALLARSGADVALVDTSAAHREAIGRDGVTIIAPDGSSSTVPVPISAAVADADAVLVLVKAYATAAVAAALDGVLAEHAVVVTLQNGLGNDRALAAVLGPAAVIAGSTTVGAEQRAPGVVAVVPGTLDGRSLTSLALPPEEPARTTVTRLAAALERAGLPTEVRPGVGSVIWRKLALAAVIGPLCAVRGATVADVVADPGQLEAGFAEVVAVAAAEGVVLDGAELWQHALSTYAAIGPHVPSLALDVAAGRPTEADAQLGELRRRARARGVRTPVLDGLAARLAIAETLGQVAATAPEVAGGYAQIRAVIDTDGALPAAHKALLVACGAIARHEDDLAARELARGRALGLDDADIAAAGAAFLLMRGEAPAARLAAAAGGRLPAADAPRPPDDGDAIAYFLAATGADALPTRMQLMADHAPAVFAGYHRMHHGVLADPARAVLSELAMVTVNAAELATAFVAIHAATVRRAGATDAQLVEAIVCAFPCAGVAAWAASAEAANLKGPGPFRNPSANLKGQTP